MCLGRLSNGEKISAISAVLLFASMFFHWFGVNGYDSVSFFPVVERVGEKNALEALDYIPIALQTTIVVTLAMTMLRLAGTVRKPSVPANATVAILGLVSTLLILYRILDPPVFEVDQFIIYEGVALWQTFLAMVAAAGIACGGCLAMQAERTRRRAPATP